MGIIVYGIKAVFGSNLKYYRKKRRLSQEQLSEKVGITPKHLSAIETGAAFVSAELLEKLAQNLEVSVSALFYSVDEKSLDDSFLNNVDRIIEKEVSKALETVKVRIRSLPNE
ncbi:MAG: helix-turn-helix domain-containing protein [Spirochaetaceae bacterium]|jgi:transcriptional regulator with XRE-family HTH domain|nr:helix-turn-helix domain-containing protein [Spirochaetaceae bacterium]